MPFILPILSEGTRDKDGFSLHSKWVAEAGISGTWKSQIPRMLFSLHNPFSQELRISLSLKRA